MRKVKCTGVCPIAVGVRGHFEGPGQKERAEGPGEVVTGPQKAEAPLSVLVLGFS